MISFDDDDIHADDHTLPSMKPFTQSYSCRVSKETRSMQRFLKETVMMIMVMVLMLMKIMLMMMMIKGDEVHATLPESPHEDHNDNRNDDHEDSFDQFGW